MNLQVHSFDSAATLQEQTKLGSDGNEGFRV